MLLISDVFNLLLDELRTDKRGLSCEIDEFNRILRLVNQDVYNDYTKKFEKDIDSTDTLGLLKVHNYALSPDAVTGVVTLPENYARIIGRPRALVGTTTVYMDIVTSYEHGCREDDYLTKATTVHPTCRIGGIDAAGEMQIRVTPVGIGTIYIDYLKDFDNTPFLDYYVNNTTYNYTFLAETSTLQTVPIGSTYRDGTPGTGVASTVSLTKNLIWGNDELALVLTKMVNRVAKQLPDELLLQTSMAEQTKSEQ